MSQPEADDLTVPATDEHAARLAKLAAIAVDGGRIKQAREAIGLAYGLGRNIGRLEGSASAARAWQASIDKHFPQQPSDASSAPGTNVPEEK